MIKNSVVHPFRRQLFLPTFNISPIFPNRRATLNFLENFSITNNQRKEIMSKINIFCHFLSIRLLKKLSVKIFLDSNMTYPLKSKNVYNRRRITLSETLISLFLNYPFSSLFQFFDTVLQILKTANFGLSENV